MASSSRNIDQVVKLSQSVSNTPTGVVEFFSGLNIFLAFTAFLGNVLILFALRRVTSIHQPTKLLFQCLAMTDLCVGFIVQPLFCAYFMLHVREMNVKSLLYFESWRRFNKHFMWDICFDVNCNQCGQTSCLDAGYAIQTCRNLQSNSLCCHFFLVYWYSICGAFGLEKRRWTKFIPYFHCAVSDYLNFLFRQDIP